MHELRKITITALLIFLVGLVAYLLLTTISSITGTGTESQATSSTSQVVDGPLPFEVPEVATTTATTAPNEEGGSTTLTIQSTHSDDVQTSDYASQETEIFDTLEARVTTEGWKTCKNERDGWEMQYPPDWYTYEHRGGVRTSNCDGGMITFANWTPEEGETLTNLHEERPYLFVTANLRSTKHPSYPDRGARAYANGTRNANGDQVQFFGMYDISGVKTAIVIPVSGSAFIESVNTRQIELQTFAVDPDLLLTMFSTFHFVNSDDTKEQLAAEPQNVVAHHDTSTWETCRNEWYGWEFRFPSEWYVYEDGNGLLSGTCHGSYTYIGAWEPDTLDSIYLNSYQPSISLVSGDAVFRNMDTYSSVEEMTKDLTKDVLPGRETRARNYRIVDDHTFAWLTGTHGGLYVWHEGQPTKISVTKVDDVLLETMLSTFRFFEPRKAFQHLSALTSVTPQKVVSMSDWRTCRNVEYGYQFNVPKEWNFFAANPYEIASDCVGPVVQASNDTRAQIQSVSQPTVIKVQVEEDVGTLNTYWETVPQGPDEPTQMLYRLDDTDAVLSTSYSFSVLDRYREFWNIVSYKDGNRYTFTITMTPTKENEAIIETILASFMFQ